MAAAFVDPFGLVLPTRVSPVIFLVIHDLQHEDSLALVHDPGDEPVFVAANIEDDAVSHEIGIGVGNRQIRPVVPGGTLDDLFPGQQFGFRRDGIATLGLPELSQSPPRNDSHGLIIGVRYLRYQEV